MAKVTKDKIIEKIMGLGEISEKIEVQIQEAEEIIIITTGQTEIDSTGYVTDVENMAIQNSILG